MTAETLWARFQAEHPDISDDYEAWQFGADADDADLLAGLVQRGIKTATSSLFMLYALEDEPLPKAGEYSVILNSRGQAVCIIQTTRVYIQKFADITESHAFKEGEGDRSLAYWREVHERFFSRELAPLGKAFDGEMEVVCEEFEMVFAG